MAKFQIPEHVKPGFAAIVKLSPDQTLALTEAIKDLPVGASPKTFIKHIKSNLDISEINKIAVTLSSLVGIRLSENTSDDELAQEIAESYSESITSKLSDKELLNLSGKLLQFFLVSTNLNITFKAQSLILSNEKTYRKSKVLSDIRIVFNDEIKENNRHAVIIHKLIIKYLNDDDKEIYISLDISDLKELKVQVDRAIEKDRIIKEDYKGVITFIDIE